MSGVRFILAWTESPGVMRHVELDEDELKSQMQATSLTLCQVANSRAVDWLVEGHLSGTPLLQWVQLGPTHFVLACLQLRLHACEALWRSLTTPWFTPRCKPTHDERFRNPQHNAGLW